MRILRKPCCVCSYLRWLGVWYPTIHSFSPQPNESFQGGRYFEVSPSLIFWALWSNKTCTYFRVPYYPQAWRFSTFLYQWHFAIYFSFCGSRILSAEEVIQYGIQVRLIILLRWSWFSSWDPGKRTSLLCWLRLRWILTFRWSICEGRIWISHLSKATWVSIFWHTN